MKVFVTGGTGFVGQLVVKAFQNKGADIVLLTRDKSRASTIFGDGITIVEGNPIYQGEWQKFIKGCDLVINLSGQGIADKRWDARYRQILRDSRVESTRNLVEGIGVLDSDDRPKVLLSASAVDYYPFDVDLGRATLIDEDDEITETCPPGSTFLGRLCQSWEKEALRANDLSVRVVLLRFGIILGDGGALQKLRTLYKFCIGGRLGHGRQWMSWIDSRDVVRAIIFLSERDDISGPVNCVAPDPRRNKDFSNTLAKSLNRPAWVPTPAFALKIAVGEFSEYLLHGRRVWPALLLSKGFNFSYSKLEKALENSK